MNSEMGQVMVELKRCVPEFFWKAEEKHWRQVDRCLSRDSNHAFSWAPPVEPTFWLPRLRLCGGLCLLYRALWDNYVMLTNDMRTFWISVLIQFILSSTCFEHLVFIIRKTTCTCSFVETDVLPAEIQSVAYSEVAWIESRPRYWLQSLRVFLVYSDPTVPPLGYCNFIVVMSAWKNVPYKTACTNGLPDDEHVMFETCRSHKELN